MSVDKYIVTTTIHSPTPAILKFCQKQGWHFLIVGDQQTPHHDHHELEKRFPNVTYLSPSYQEDKYPKISDAIGWHSIQRRNIGFIEAYHRGAQIIATVDDDNIPYAHWGEELLIGKEVEVDVYETASGIFDPLAVTEHNYLWHRGFPIELLSVRHNVTYVGKQMRRVFVQADLWDGDPDIDAMARLTFSPEVTFDQTLGPFSTNGIMPFNSQNTFLSREVIPLYCVIPFIGRVDDIWASYILQYHVPNSIVFSKPTVYQARNQQNIINNLEDELFGYRNTFRLLHDLPNYLDHLPKEAVHCLQAYRACFGDELQEAFPIAS